MNWSLHPSAAFAAHAAQWQRLNDDSVRSPLLHPDFIQPLLDQFATPQTWLAVCRQQEQVVAMALLQQRRGGRWDSWQPSQQPLSLWLNQPQQNVPALLRSLLAALPGWPLVCNITRRDPALTPRPAHDATLHTVDAIDTARVTIQGSFDEYWQRRSRNLRHSLAKQRHKLERAGITPRLQIERGVDAMAQAVADYGRLESAGWKARAGTAVHAENAQGHFYRALLEGFAQRGKACVLRYWFNERLVAMNLCVEGDGSLIVLKTAYDEQLEGHFSPAFLMREETLRHLFAQAQPGSLEFYGRTRSWHLRWTDEVRTMYHITQYRWPLLCRLHTLWRSRRSESPTPATADAGFATGKAD